jgi:hypothetical protein
MSDEKQIDESDISQDSPAEAEAEVTDPDGRDDDEAGTAGVLGIAPLGVAGGAGGNLGRL